MKELSRQRKWQLKKQQLGLCTICGKPTINHILCPKHTEKNRIIVNRLRRRKAGIPINAPLKKTKPRKPLL